MGGCVSSFPSDEPPRCEDCGFTGSVAWKDMGQAMRKAWVRHGPMLTCRKCELAKHPEGRVLRQERERLQKVKFELYPRASKKTTLKRIESGQEWEGTKSFYASWTPPPPLAHLVDPTPKPLSLLQPAEEECGTQEGLVAGLQVAAPPQQGQVVQEAQQAQQAQLEQLEQIQQQWVEEVVEEEWLACCLESPVQGGLVGFGEEGGQEEGGWAAAAVAEARQEPCCSPEPPRAAAKPLQLKPHAAAFGNGIAQREDTANSEDWSPAARQGNGRGSGGAGGPGFLKPGRPADLEVAPAAQEGGKGGPEPALECDTPLQGPEPPHHCAGC